MVEVCSGQSCASASADANALSVATAQAFASANGEGCVNGVGTLDVTQETLATAVATAYASALTNVVAGVSDGSAMAGADSVADSSSGDDVSASSEGMTAVTGDAQGSSGGSADASTEQNFRCQRPFSVCCTSSLIRKGSCRCSARNCNMELLQDDATQTNSWKLLGDINTGTRSNPVTVKEGFICFCDN